MRILVTGANGYIGQRLIPVLLEAGHTVICCVRNRKRFLEENRATGLEVFEIDFLEAGPESHLPQEVDAAYYLIHSMSRKGNFTDKEAQAAHTFNRLIANTHCRQVIYLGGISNDSHLSGHLKSRLAVEKILRSGKIPVTALRAGIIVGSGSASFEIIRDLVEKLPVMITPKWLNTPCQPIAIRNVIQFLSGVLLRESYYNRDFDIGGREVLTYKEMLLQFAAARGLKRWVLTLPVMTPRLSSYWLYFITSTSYPLAVNLVDSMKVPVICRPNNLANELGIELLTYLQAVTLAFQKIEQQLVASSWKDSFSASDTPTEWMERAEVPVHGCFTDVRVRELPEDHEFVLRQVWQIGGEQGWYYGNWLWALRGHLDKLFGGVGLRRGRTHRNLIRPGDALDFWRVLVADRSGKRLLLYAEMKLPGEAWLEFRVIKKEDKYILRQTATFRPKGLWGRIYWYVVLPFHHFIFNGMINRITQA